MFPQVERSTSFPQLEEQIIRFWRDRQIYEKSLAARKGAPEFVFYEGPPTANGLPHPGHCLTRAVKDLFPRYKTMRGYHCRRRAGWDTHGLPVEVEVCKELGIHSKEEIEKFGVEPFIHRCIESVFRYTREWEQLTERLGFWIHLDEAYVTFHQSYVESVWWALKNLFERGLLYQGHKIVWWWAQGGTALSSGEVGQGYRQVADPSVYVRFPLLDEPNVDLLVWTTTPWTLPSNQFAAVKPDLDYAYVEFEGVDGTLIIASALVDTIAQKLKTEAKVVRSVKGADLIGKRYKPPFDYYYKSAGEKRGKLADGGEEYIAWRVVGADFVTIESGTGIVHQAPAFGEVDYDVLLSEQARFAPGEGPELICAVGPDGKFTDEAPDYEGRWVKDCDRDIARELKAKGLLLHQEQYLHDYPFCWRAEEDPLIQYPRKSWFIRTTALKDRMLANNAQIRWLPEHIRDGRFGNFLETNVDWALSRERFWGTPLPIWVCEKTGYMEAIGSYEELLGKPGVSGTEVWEEAKRANPDLPDHLKVHKPYIDAITYDSPKAPGARMRRVPEVIDCWFDSGAMPFAQWGFPHQPGSREALSKQFPADFISEAIDQTRGWFYSLLAISTLLFGPENDTEPTSSPEAFKTADTPKLQFPHPFKNCIVLGLMLGEDGQKMSKSKRNYREPQEIFDRYGADALRWYFYSNQAPWTSIRYNEQAIRESVPEFLLRLWNVYSFFVIYANIDGFNPAESISGSGLQLTPEHFADGKGYRPISDRNELDRWILSELHATTAGVIADMDRFDSFPACRKLSDFVDALSNWYVRRSRDRFWAGEKTQDKQDAYWTLYECLITTIKLIAPFVPFLAERLWQDLAVSVFGDRVVESVHLCDYPAPKPELVDRELSANMADVRELVSLGRAARMSAKLKVRQPLACVEVVPVRPESKAWLSDHAELICEELNVKKIEFLENADAYIDYVVVPNFKRLGPRLGKKMPVVKRLLQEADGSSLLSQLESGGKITLEAEGETIELDQEDIEVRLNAKEGWTAAQGKIGVVILNTELTDELLAEGRARDIVHLIQGRRKDLGCEFTDRIRIGLVSDSPAINAAIDRFRDYIAHETLATEIQTASLPGAEPLETKVAGEPLTIYVEIHQNAS
ncbi:isoleucine--tRNA ligase [Thermostilla marina]